ncbi:hypothetical protein FPQ18DRAFT_321741 [Pyronema domesticum]|nr:hypothetical protein FPQ18DRAFT_321741 [Pyronema domesticum]
MVSLRNIAVTALLFWGTADAAFYGKNSPVVSLDKKNFKEEILDSRNAAVVAFVAPWCGHCQNLKPSYAKLAESLKGIVKVAAIDCDEEANKRTCGEYGVQGFPTIKIFKPSKKKGKPIVEDYMGERTAKAISDQITKRIPDHVKRLTDTTFEEFLANKNESAKAILFTNKAKPSPLWKSLAIDFIDVIQFAQVPNSEKAVVEKFGVEKFPTIVMLPGGKKEGVVYEGELKKQQLFDFFKEFQEPKEDPWAAVGTEEESTPSSSSSSKTAATSSSSSVAPKPTEEAKPEIPIFSGVDVLYAACLEKKTKTCIINIADTPSDGLVKAYATLESRPPPHPFQVWRVYKDDALAKIMTTMLELDDTKPQLIAISHRGWYRKFTGDIESSKSIMTWLDEIKMGEGTKVPLPQDMIDIYDRQPGPEPEAEASKEETKEGKKTEEKETDEKKTEKVAEKAEEVKEKVEEKVKFKDEL